MLPYCQRVLEQNKSVILSKNSMEVNSYERAALLLDFAQSVCLIPLRVGKPGLGSKQALGLLMLGETRSEGREPFTPAKILLSESIGDQAANAIRRMLLYEQTEQRLQHITALRKIDQSITSSSSLYISLGIVLNQVVEQLRVDAAAVWLFNPASNMLEYSVGRGFHSKTYEQEEKPLRLGEGYAGRAALELCTIHISNLAEQEDNPRLKQALANEAFVRYYAVPLIAKEGIKGVMEIFQRTPLEPDEEWLGFLDTLAGQAAIAIDNATLFENLQTSNKDLMEAYDTTLEGWSAALDLRDKETEGHTQRVTKMTVRLAESMGFNQQQLLHVRRGALLHDIGKMGVPDRILLKPGKLTDEEWEIMRKHPVYAYQLLKPITYLGSALDIPYCHHEKWDGTGYPRGLTGEEIPLAARIFSVIDIYDALTSDRPYREAWTIEKTSSYIRELSGTHLDPQVVEAFLKMSSKDE
jgi:putative nucleotidyltransferase with HDIG domain